MERNEKLDVVRCIANYIIILLHAGAAFQYCNSQTFEFKFWIAVCWDMCQIALPALFLISGYLLFYNYKISEYPHKIMRRIKRLLVPYLAWNITFVLFYLIMGNLVPRLGTRVASFGLDTWEGALSKIVSFTEHPIDGPLWFIRALFVLSIVSPIFWILIKSKVGRYIGASLIGVTYLVCWQNDWIGELVMLYPLYAVVLFFMGGGTCHDKQSQWKVQLVQF